MLGALVDDLVGELGGRPLVVVSDTRVMPLHARPLAERLRDRGLSVAELSFPEGEASKSRETKARLEDRLFELGVGRDAVLIAVGGGVTGDLVGFIASTWHRGATLVQVPTTVLAMSDAALGGKTAVNLPGAKNLVGTVHQPWGIYADVSVLRTLDEAEYRNGFAEVIKSAVIADASFFRWLESAAGELVRRDPAALERAVLRCLEIKSRVVARDERESGRRAVLNFGHTIGHALEAASGYRMRHGEAVAAGICLEGRLAVGETGFPRTALERLERLVGAFGLPARPPAELSADAIAAATYRDKKVVAGKVHYALPVRIGRMLPGSGVTLPLDEARLRGVVEEASTG